MTVDGGGGEERKKNGLKNFRCIQNSTPPPTAATVIGALSHMKLASASNVQSVFLHVIIFVPYSEVSKCKPQVQSRSHTS